MRTALSIAFVKLYPKSFRRRRAGRDVEDITNSLVDPQLERDVFRIATAHRRPYLTAQQRQGRAEESLVDELKILDAHRFDMRETGLKVDVRVRPLRHSGARRAILRQCEAQERLRVRHDLERERACSPALPSRRLELRMRRLEAVGVDHGPGLELEREPRCIVAGCRRGSHAEEGTTVTLRRSREEEPVGQEIEVLGPSRILPIGIVCSAKGNAMPDQRLHAPTAAAEPVALRLREDDRCRRHGPLEEEIAHAVSRRAVGQLLAGRHTNRDSASNDKGRARVERSESGEDLLALSRRGERQFGGDHCLGSVEQHRREWNVLHHFAAGDDGNAISQRDREDVRELACAGARCRRRRLVEGQHQRGRPVTVRDRDARFLDEPDLIERQGISRQHVMLAAVPALEDIGICRSSRSGRREPSALSGGGVAGPRQGGWAADRLAGV